ncbi:UDP-4-amino-4,6-dideoxy-N-acetyl-beta-L-altrosami ne transaminase [Fundidesulfovibrio butyratiphilus]
MTNTRYLPYGRHQIDEDDVLAVSQTLRSDWLTTGPKVEALERSLCDFTGAAHAVAVSSGTAALHAAMHALGVGPGDEVVVSPLTFAASANCVLYQGARPVFADVDPDTLLLDPQSVARVITPRTRAIIAVDYAGQPCDYERLRGLADSVGAALVSDACHALGARDRERTVGTLADVTVFSFHPVKHITTGEGGMAVTDDPQLARRMRRFRNHGIDLDHREREKRATWRYEMVELGYNFRLPDILCALGVSQMKKLPGFLAKRRELARLYDRALAETPGVRPLVTRPGALHAYHLYVVRLESESQRELAFSAMRAAGIGVNVHYWPVHLHPYYRERLGTGEGLCPAAEEAGRTILTLPLHPGMTESDVDRVVTTLGQSLVP